MAVPPTLGKGAPDLDGEPNDMAAEKARLRQRLRFRRDHFLEAMNDFDRAVTFRALPPPLRALIGAATVVGGYAATASEAPVDRLLQAAHSMGVATALPYFAAREAKMGFVRWSPGDPLGPGPWRVEQPTASSPGVSPDLLLVPLLGFDRSGGRLGQGGGHYDRYCAANPAALRIGIGWAVQELDRVPRSPQDLPMDAILTEQEWILTGDRLS